MTSTLLDWKRKHGITAKALTDLVTKPVPDSTGNCSVLYHVVDPAKCKSAMAVTNVTFD